jgi:uncharacterized protein (DUF2147 family)
MKSVILSVVLLVIMFASSSFHSASDGYHLAGVWESDEKNLQIEMFEKDGVFCGRMVYFKCETDEIMRASKDIENPDKALTNRNLLGLTLVTELSYQGGNVWDEGKIYDPNSGRTFEARIQLTGSNSAIVRGYWKYRWIGRSMVFYRKK